MSWGWCTCGFAGWVCAEKKSLYAANETPKPIVSVAPSSPAHPRDRSEKACLPRRKRHLHHDDAALCAAASAGRASMKDAGGRLEIVTILGAMSLGGMIATMSRRRSHRYGIFLAYLDHFLCPA